MDFQNPNNQITPPKPRHQICKFLLKVFCFIGAALTFIRNFISNAILLALCLVVWLAIEFADNVKDLPQTMIQGQTQNLPAQKDALIYMPLAGVISEMPFSESEIDILSREINQSLSGTDYHSIDGIEKALKAASSDPEIRGLLINLDNMGPISMAMAERIGKALDAFQTSRKGEKKQVVVFASNYNQTRYIIASHANEIVLDPLGKIEFKGIGLNTLYYKDLFERFKITPYIFRAGEFKSAVEPFVRNDMSSVVKDEYQHIADQIWQEYLHKIRQRIGSGDLIDNLLKNPQTYIDTLKQEDGNFASLALKLKLCDSVESFEQLQLRLSKDYGLKDNSLYTPKSISYNDYLKLYVKQAPSLETEAKLACIYGIGDIVDTPTETSDFSPKNLVPLLDKIALDDNIKGVLFYINSGGGSVVGSEKISRALIRVKNAGKKIVVSFNGVGASGAYWIASHADKIVATDETITGSIGVFGMSFGFDKLLNEYGVSQDGVVTHEFANTNIAKPMSDYEIALNTASVNGIYKKFINLVTQNRPQLKDLDYKSYAEGKVFIAKEATGLIDEIGDKNHAYKLLNDLLANQNGELLPLVNMVPSKDENLSFLQGLFFKNFSSYLPDELTKVLLDLANKSKSKLDNPSLMAISPLKLQIN